MNRFVKSEKPAPIIIVIILCCCMAVSLMDYTPPTYDVTAKPLKAEDFAQDTADGTTVLTEKEDESILIAGSFDLEDGVYEGEGSGYGGTIKVAVTIKDHTIVSIEVLSAPGEDSVYLSLAKSIIDIIIASQSTDVDTVSGATYSSRGILNAVINALTGVEDANESPNADGSASVGLGATTVALVSETSEWNDGTYYGTGTGFGGTVKVKVVISGGKIIGISVVSHSDGSEYMSRASSGIISAIISAQSTNVDTVSGATYSSVGIIEAVRSALNQAAGKSSSDSSSADSSTALAQTLSQKSAVPSVSGNFPYNDGYYEGVGYGYLDGETVVGITIKNKTITAIKIVSTEDDDTFFARAKNSIINAIISSQSTKVDAVSGATYSSNGIIEAVKNALEAAKAATTGTAALTNKQNNTGSSSNKTSSNNGGSNSGDNTGDNSKVNETGYKDGSYTVTVLCSPDEDEDFEAYNLTLTVTIKNGAIVSVTDVSGDGDPDNDAYINRAANGSKKAAGLIEQIVSSNGTKYADTISGATCSSNAIIEAVNSALKEAGIISDDDASNFDKTDNSGSKDDSNIKDPSQDESSSVDEDRQNEQNPGEESQGNNGDDSDENPGDDNTAGEEPGNETDPGDEDFEEGGSGDEEDSGGEGEDKPAVNKYLDGTYSASVVCYPEDGDDSFDPYNVTVTVVIENGIIVSVINITGDGDEENDVYMRYAIDGRTRRGVVYPSIPSQIVDKNGTDGIDAVSGATCSSDAIIEAVRSALNQALNPEYG